MNSRRALYLDSSTCIACCACEVACREWNRLEPPAPDVPAAYGAGERLGGEVWRRVSTSETTDEHGAVRILFYSDSCKHCGEAPCMRACPTGAIARAPGGGVRVVPELCDGCGHCLPACPFEVLGLDRRQVVARCTLCEDRLAAEQPPACVAVCPTGCLDFGPRHELLERARARVAALRAKGAIAADVHGEHELGGLGVISVLVDEPVMVGLPDEVEDPASRLLPALATAAAWTALGLLLLAWLWRGA